MREIFFKFLRAPPTIYTSSNRRYKHITGIFNIVLYHTTLKIIVMKSLVYFTCYIFQAGKCYIVDFNEKFKTLPRNVHLATKEPLHCPNAVGLFPVNAKGDFLPIAIQLVPGDRDYLFTPADSKDDWLLAKMYFRTAESSLHEVSSIGCAV